MPQDNSVKDICCPEFNAPALYATFSPIYNGKVLADRYISPTRLNTILKKEALT